MTGDRDPIRLRVTERRRAAGAAAQPADQKALPNSICVPAKPGQAGDFRYRLGRIRSVGTAPRNVECPVLRDGFFGGDDRIEALNGFIEQPGRGRTRCRVRRSVRRARFRPEDGEKGG